MAKGIHSGAAPWHTRITPSPPVAPAVTSVKLPKSSLLHRVHLADYGATVFNPGLRGNARFSPIVNAGGTAIPTMYAGSTFACAAMETVFHDVPFCQGLKTIDEAKFASQVHSTFLTKSDLQLADLRSIALRKLGVSREQLIATEKDQYPYTREWAAAIHTAFPDIQGLFWISRQDDDAKAYMFFGDRIPAGTLVQTGTSCSLLDDKNTYAGLLDLAERLDVCIVPGK
ncbi:MAG: RES family NAD+ phosphorylase [Hydrogenophaga sp.]|nr:RES family NAD+ phosphorylase [Hydrogenophaga sp.]